MTFSNMILVGVALFAIVGAIGAFTVAFRRTRTEEPIDPTAGVSQETRKSDRSMAGVRVEPLPEPEPEPEPEPAAEREPEPEIEEEPELVPAGAGVQVVERQRVVEVTPEESGVTRRQFFNRALSGTFFAFLGLVGINSLAFFWPKLSGGFGTDVDAGSVSDIQNQTVAPDGSIVPVFVPEARAYVVPAPTVPESMEGDDVEAAGLMALFQRCVHLGCRVPWCATSQGFECPCHGSKYSSIGEYFAGPAPRNLDRFVVTVENDRFIIRTANIIQTPRAQLLSVSYPPRPQLHRMTANIITVLAVVAGIVWLGLVVVSALRNRGAEEVAPNLQPGKNDQELETRRLETGQKVAIAASAFLAISLPLYFLSEQTRQEGFVEEFEEASIERGEHLVEEFACYSCHGPLGVGGSATFVEKRSGVTVSWAAPAINDVFYRYDADEVNYWLTFGRGNTPMPAWGLAGGGPMNEKQIEDVVNYLRTIQIDQQEAVDAVAAEVSVQLSRLDNADTTIETAIINQRQTVAELEQAPQDAEFITPLADRADEILENAGEGIDTDDDGLSDTAEQQLSEISVEASQYYQVIEPVQLDPETADAELLDQGLEDLRAAAENDPILLLKIAAIESILAGEETAGEETDGEETDGEETDGEEGESDAEAGGEDADADADTDTDTDTDGDGITDQAETAVSGQFVEASNETVPDRLSVISLDPTNPESTGGQADLTAATAMVGGLDTLRINTGVAAENQERLLENEEAGLEFLLNAAQRRAWEIDIAGVAEAMGTSEEDAERAVGLYQANCARCHTAGFSAGIPFTQEAGSGGFGPALWDGRPVVQFGEDPAEAEADLLVDFLINGSVANAPYGLNGFGSGRMPAFGTVLPVEDLELLAAYLRSGNLDGKGEAIEDVLP